MRRKGKEGRKEGWQTGRQEGQKGRKDGWKEGRQAGSKEDSKLE
jgi:hypothetical protein